MIEGSGRGSRVAGLRLGILGGAFNPPHLGHLVCAQEALVQLELEKVVFVPVGEAPHRELEDDPGAGGAARDGRACDRRATTASRPRGSRSSARGRRTPRTRWSSCSSRVAGRRAVPDPRRRPGGGAARPGTSPRRCSSARALAVFERMSWGRNAIVHQDRPHAGARATCATSTCR